MLTLIVRSDEILSAWRVSALLYDVTEDGTRHLVATAEDWLTEWPEDDGADALTRSVRTTLRWAVMTIQRHE